MLVNAESVFGTKPASPELLAHQSTFHAIKRGLVQSLTLLLLIEEAARRLAEMTAWVEEPSFRASLDAFVARKGLVRKAGRKPDVISVTMNYGIPAEHLC